MVDNYPYWWVLIIYVVFKPSVNVNEYLQKFIDMSSGLEN